MIKNERHEKILELINSRNVMKVSDLVTELNVTDMTVRRDLQELEDENLLIRIHGGARKKEDSSPHFLELSHRTKRELNTESKIEIAKTIAKNILDNETVFLGSGTTIELVYDYLDINDAKIITNSIYVFNKFRHDERFDLVLAGGTYRSKTGSFAGSITNDFLSSIYVQKAFIGVNAIDGHLIFNANEDEGVVQRTAFNNAQETYAVADHTKFNKLDFYQFYDLKDVDYLISDKKLDKDIKEKYKEWVQIIN